jgi:predicted DNA-binding mobile mystery protein A
MDELALNQIEKRLKKLRKVLNEAHVSPGWIYYMRHALSLTLEKLGKRAKLSKSTIQQVEKREAQGRITLATLQKLAHAMDCEFIYAFVPNNELKTFLFEKAYKKAEKIIKNADVHMTLEDQKVTEEIELRIKRLAQELMTRGDIW